jgi:hypothetical protein
MTKGIVDGFEPVQVKVDHRQQLVTPLHVVHGLVEPVSQQHPVGQAGEGVKVGNALQLLFVLLERGDV